MMATLAFNELTNFPMPLINLDSVLAYYKRFLNTENQKFTFSPTSMDEVLKLLKDINPEKVAGIDNLSGRFLKDVAVCFSFDNIKTMQSSDETFKISFRL